MHEFRVYFPKYSFSEGFRLREPFLDASYAGSSRSSQALLGLRESQPDATHPGAPIPITSISSNYAQNWQSRRGCRNRPGMTRVCRRRLRPLAPRRPPPSSLRGLREKVAARAADDDSLAKKTQSKHWQETDFLNFRNQKLSGICNGHLENTAIFRPRAARAFRFEPGHCVRARIPCEFFECSISECVQLRESDPITRHAGIGAQAATQPLTLGGHG
jgi:hypothetical protein